MGRTDRLRILLCCLVLAVAVCPARTSGQALDSALTEQTISELKMVDVHLMAVLWRLAVKYRVPIGFEYPLNDKDVATRLSIDVKGAKLKDVLDLVVRHVPGYVWEVRDGVINFIPTQSRDPFLKELLSTDIHRPKQIRGITNLRLRDALTELREVQGLLEANHVRAFNLGYANGGWVPFPEELELNVSDMDVRAILNKIARDTDRKLWSVQRLGEKKDVLYLIF